MQTDNRSFLKPSISIKALTFGDWKIIASSVVDSNSSKWAFHRWAENTDTDLSTLTIKDWETIAEDCGFKDGWAYFQYKTYR